ncbi:MAG: hypothetical protein RQ714_05395 [Nitrosomonas sp.]|nr:hypothetical protein [Nitrosomonas sp.]
MTVYPNNKSSHITGYWSANLAGSTDQSTFTGQRTHSLPMYQAREA